MKKILTIIIVVIALQLVVASVAFASGGTYHKVRYGETLYSIGRNYGISAYRIADANGLNNPNYIHAGQVLYIPSGGGNTPCNYDCNGNNGVTFHKVRYGETLFSIGRQHGVNPYRIARVNNLYNPNYIYAGQKLRIPSGGHGYHDGGYDRGRWDGHRNRGNDCYSDCNNNRWSDCNSGCNNNHWSDCNSGCQQQKSGFDYTAYYYSQGDQRYSYTCGYHYNCW